MRKIRVLLIEDSPSDVNFVRIGLDQFDDVEFEMHVESDGVGAIDYLQDNRNPHLIIMDLNLPTKNGIEVLEQIKRDPNLKSIPVIVLTTSDRPEDILASYNVHANAFIKKPMQLAKFMEQLRAIKNFWVSVATLPEP